MSGVLPPDRWHRVGEIYTERRTVVPMSRIPRVFVLSVLAAEDADFYQHRGLDYQYYAAEQYFLYGQWDAARQRYDAMWKENCKKNEYGYKALGKLITIAARSLDVKESRRLAEAEEQHSCAVTAEQVKEVDDCVAWSGRRPV